MAKTKICVFTDSRGDYRPTPGMRMFHEELGDDYEVVRFTQPYKWTSIPDFLMLVRDGTIAPSQYDYVVLWAGVVDFSPRPFRSCYRELLGGQNRNMVSIVPGRASYYERTINRKVDAIDRIVRNRYMQPKFAVERLDWALCPPYAVGYNGEATASLYSKEFVDRLASELNAIPNLIFIDTCGIHPTWDGNFFKGRPRNMGETVAYNNRLTEQLRCPIIRQSDWSEDELVERTIDSMHVNQAGSDVIKRELLEIMKSDRHTDAPTAANFILTGTDSTFFATTLAMIETAFERSSGAVDGIAVLDIGLERPQREILENLRGVHVFDYRDEDVNELRKLDFDFFDPKTYGFKVYLTTKAPDLIRERIGEIDKLRLMYVDGGILINDDLSDIFRTIATDGIFCVDHDECRDLYDFRTFLLNVLSPTLIEDGTFDKLPLEKLAKPYIKAGFFGYEHGGKYQKVVDDLWDLSRKTRVLTAPKATKNAKERNWFLDNTDIKAFVEERHGTEQRLILEYVGSRQDQTALSYLVAKHDAPIHNSRDFNFTVSTGAGRKAWNQIVARLEKKNPECKVDRDAFWENHNERDNRKTPASLVPMPNEARSSATILHRGALVDEDMMKNAGRLMNRARNLKNDTFILLGNGPSLGDVDLKSLEPYSTFGLNAAYRAYERMGFWPTYFGCFDAVVCGHHSAKFKELIKDSPIEKFFFINYNEKKQPNFPEPEIQASPKFANINFVERSVPEKERTDIISMSFDPFIDMLTSGSNAIQCALLMGYRKIVLLGCDANYVEVVEGASHETNRNRLKMDKTPDANPNYWFADYQQEGDRFNVPNTAGCQLPAWSRLADTIADLGINAEIINCSPISKIDVFKKMPLDDALSYFDKLDVAKIGEELTPARRTHPLSVSTKTKRERVAKDDKVGHASGSGETLYTDRVPGAVEMLKAMDSQTGAPTTKPAPAPAPAPVPAATEHATSPVDPAPSATLLASASEQSMAKPSTPARSPRMDKLRRDPHLFFKDSHSALLRPLRHLFRPTGITRAQAEVRAQLRTGSGGIWSWLPVSRFALAQAMMETERKIAQVKAANAASLRDQIASVDETIRLVVSDQVTHIRGEVDGVRKALRALKDQLSLLREDLASLNDEQDDRSVDFAALVEDIDRKQADIAKRVEASALANEENLAAGQAMVDRSIEKLVELMEDTNRKLSDADERAEQSRMAVSEEVAAAINLLEEVGAQVRDDLDQRLQDAIDALRAAVEEKSTELASGVMTKTEAVESRLASTLSAFKDAEAQRVERLSKAEAKFEAIGNDVATFKSQAAHEQRLSPVGNSSTWRLHDRTLSREEIGHIRTHWLKPLGLFMSEQQVSYLAHRIALAEERCEGRMATSIQSAVIRAAALLSLQVPDIELLEIGTLFGIASGSLHEVGRRANKSVSITMIDPLEGYYGQSLQDSTTGVPVTRQTLHSNMRALGVPEDDYRIIEALSASDEAVEQASDRQYDYVLIDGDHSIEGVSADFELYGPMVKPGGVLIFDDYGTSDWPAIQKYVDENVRNLHDWLWIGGEYRSGVLRRKRTTAANSASRSQKSGASATTPAKTVKSKA